MFRVVDIFGGLFTAERPPCLPSDQYSKANKDRKLNPKKRSFYLNEIHSAGFKENALNSIPRRLSQNRNRFVLCLQRGLSQILLIRWAAPHQK